MLVAWVVFLAGALVMLQAIGTGSLQAPPVRQGTTELARWYQSRDVASMTFAVVRVGTLAAAWYLLLTTVLSSALRLAGVVRAARLVDMLTLPAVRALIQSAVGATVAATAMAAVARGPILHTPLASAEARATDAIVTMRRLDQHSPSTTTVERSVTMRRMHDAAAIEPQASPATAPTTWLVKPGDHFWNIAERAVSASLGRPASVGEIDPYWRRLIAVNRARLVDPRNPDLIVSSQVLELPPVS
jgi:nucleoid-associated protein YgaU